MFLPDRVIDVSRSAEKQVVRPLEIYNLFYEKKYNDAEPAGATVHARSPRVAFSLWSGRLLTFNSLATHRRVVMDQQLDQFLSNLALEKRYSENTISAYKNDLSQFLEFLNR